MNTDRLGNPLTAAVASYYPELGMGYLNAGGRRVGFKTDALRGFSREPRVGDVVLAYVNDDNVASVVTPLGV